MIDMLIMYIVNTCAWLHLSYSGRLLIPRWQVFSQRQIFAKSCWSFADFAGVNP